MIKKLVFGVLLLGGVALLGWGIVDWNTASEPDQIAQPVPASPTTTRVVEQVSDTSTTLAYTDRPDTTTTLPPPPRGDNRIECALPVELNIYFSAKQFAFEEPIPIDVSDTRFDPAKNRVDIHVSDVNGLPCANTGLPVKLLGHKQDQFCYLVLEDSSFDPCDYGIELGDIVQIVLEDGEIVTYEVVEPLPSEVSTPLSEVYPEITNPSPAVMFRKFTEFAQFYDEVFLREDAQDELWLFTSCGNDIQEGHSQDACAVRTKFRHYTGNQDMPSGAGMN